MTTAVELWRIGGFARRRGVAAKTLRYYETLRCADPSFHAAAAVMAIPVFVFALVVARPQEAKVQAMGAAEQVKRYGRFVLIGVGIWTLALVAFAEFVSQFLAV